MSKVLVADDAVFMRLMIRQILAHRESIEIWEAENGQVAIDLFNEHKPDLTFLDITMPIKDGFTTLQEILTIDPHAKIIMCSAVAQEKVVQKAIEMGATDFLIKPFRPNKFLETVNKYLRV
ncbi:response regulator [Desulfitobacterium sp.]|uniref:response regulator n=1 Tax=Desulfitobacterium sp. TaxID=49981 RepID=UPI002B523139|nr:response regulator [Desulfitobacterium sp.]HVJ48914.1 response regulator [Desulfitobacterium sp.]